MAFTYKNITFSSISETINTVLIDRDNEVSWKRFCYVF